MFLNLVAILLIGDYFRSWWKTNSGNEKRYMITLSCILIPVSETNGHNLQDLERRERQLRDEQKRLEDARVYGDRVPNFPPLPKFFPCTPCVYHNIDFDIAPEHQLTLRRLFYHWQCK